MRVIKNIYTALLYCVYKYTVNTGKRNQLIHSIPWVSCKSSTLYSLLTDYSLWSLHFMMRFLLMFMWVWLIILRLPATPYRDPSMTTVTGESPETVRFASHALLDSLMASGDVESNPGPVQYPCTVCEKPALQKQLS